MDTLMSLASQSSTNSERNDRQLSAMRDRNSKSHGSSMASVYSTGVKLSDWAAVSVLVIYKSALWFGDVIFPISTVMMFTYGEERQSDVTWYAGRLLHHVHNRAFQHQHSEVKQMCVDKNLYFDIICPGCVMPPPPFFFFKPQLNRQSDSCVP